VRQCHGLAPAGNKAAHGYSITPSHAGLGRRMGRTRHYSWVRI